jgi:hypothetical protein
VSPTPAPAPVSPASPDANPDSGNGSASGTQGNSSPAVTPIIPAGGNPNDDHNKHAPLIAVILPHDTVSPVVPDGPVHSITLSETVRSGGSQVDDSLVLAGAAAAVTPWHGLGPAVSLAATSVLDGAGLHPIFDTSPAALEEFKANSSLWHQLDAMQQQVTGEHKLHIIAGSASLVSVGMTVVYFLWALRAGSLFSSFLSSMPAWNLVDPLPILEQFAGSAPPLEFAGEGADGKDADETLESMVDR